MARRHRLALATGSLLLALLAAPPLNVLAAQRLSWHMLQEMALLALAMPLLAYGATPLLRRRIGPIGHPLSGILALNLVVFGWQLPAVLDRTSRILALREVAVLAFAAGALVFWWPVVRPHDEPAGLSRIAKIGYLMVAGVPPTIPGILLAFSHHLFYQAYRSVEDQQIAGLLLFATAKFALIGGAFVTLWRLLGPEGEPPDRDDRDRPVGDLPPSLPAWVRQLDGSLPAEPTRRGARRPVAIR